MYASAITLQVDPKRIDEIASVFNRLAPTFKEAKGWQGMYVLAERRGGQLRVVSLWETEDDARALANSAAWQAMASELRGLLTDQPRRAVLEVIFHA